MASSSVAEDATENLEHSLRRRVRPVGTAPKAPDPVRSDAIDLHEPSVDLARVSADERDEPARYLTADDCDWPELGEFQNLRREFNPISVDDRAPELANCSRTRDRSLVCALDHGVGLIKLEQLV